MTAMLLLLLPLIIIIVVVVIIIIIVMPTIYGGPGSSELPGRQLAWHGTPVLCPCCRCQPLLTLALAHLRARLFVAFSLALLLGAPEIM